MTKQTLKSQLKADSNLFGKLAHFMLRKIITTCLILNGLLPKTHYKNLLRLKYIKLSGRNPYFEYYFGLSPFNYNEGY